MYMFVREREIHRANEHTAKKGKQKKEKSNKEHRPFSCLSLFCLAPPSKRTLK